MLQRLPWKYYWPCLLSLGCAVLYLAQWWRMPLYPDEVALRLHVGRILADGPIQYGLIGFCISNVKAVPWLLWPAHYLFAAVDYYTEWKLVRLLPFASILAMLGTALALMRQAAGSSMRDRWPALFLTAGFIGVAGSGLILSRSEYLLTLQLAACLFTLWLARRPSPGRGGVVLTVVAHLFIASLACAAHVQSLLLLPLSFLTLVPLLRKLLPIAAVGVFLIALGCQCYTGNQFRCTENPTFEKVMNQYQGSIATQARPDDSVAQHLQERVERNLHNFTFNPASFYLPSYDKRSYRLPASIANVPIAFLWVLVLVSTAGALCVAWPLLRGLIVGERPFLARVGQVFFDARTLVCYAALALLFLYFYDVSINFYRSFSRHLLAVVLVAICAVYYQPPRWQIFFKWMAWIAVAACVCSILMSAIFFKKPFKHGFGGMSVASTTHWKEADAAVRSLQQRCGISTDAERVVVDDYTYGALRRQPHLIPITYLWLDSVLITGKLADETGEARLAKLRSINPAGILARCGNFSYLKLPFAQREGELCCLNMAPSHE